MRAWIGTEKSQCYYVKMFAVVGRSLSEFDRFDMSLCHFSSLRSHFLCIAFCSKAWSIFLSDYFCMERLDVMITKRSNALVANELGSKLVDHEMCSIAANNSWRSARRVKRMRDKYSNSALDLTVRCSFVAQVFPSLFDNVCLLYPRLLEPPMICTCSIAHECPH